jgi:carnitine O-acetyltransferase
LRYDTLSTSNCGGYSLSSFGFGPVVPDGWGIGYIIKDKCMHFHITNYNEEMCKLFVKQVEKALLDVAKLVTNGEPIRLVADQAKL